MLGAAAVVARCGVGDVICDILNANLTSQPMRGDPRSVPSDTDHHALRQSRGGPETTAATANPCPCGSRPGALLRRVR